MRIPSRSVARLLTAILVVAIALVSIEIVRRANDQFVAVQAVLNASGRVYYDNQESPTPYQSPCGRGANDAPQASQTERRGTLSWVGEIFRTVLGVSCHYPVHHNGSQPNPLVHLANLQQLEFLDLAGCGLVTDDLMSTIAKLPNLKKLDLSSTRVSDTGLSRLRCTNEISELNLEHSEITGIGLTNISGCKNIKVLILDGLHISDADLKHLGNLRDLTYLSLVGTNITSDGLVHLVALDDLEELHLASTRIDNRAMVHLRKLDALRVVDLRKTDVTTGASELPGVKLIPFGFAEPLSR